MQANYPKFAKEMMPIYIKYTNKQTFVYLQNRYQYLF